MSGRLIGLKSWNQSVEIFEPIWTIRDCVGTVFGCLFHNLCNKLCVGVYEAGNGHGNRFQKVEQMFDVWAAHGQPACFVLGPLKIVPGLCELDKKRPCVGCLKLLK